jgi:Carbohydrate/starch-binding module (family 21)
VVSSLMKVGAATNWQRNQAYPSPLLMIVTLSAQPIRMSHQMYSNAAGGPLPAIPRRPSNSRSASSVAQHSMKRATKSPYRMHRSSSCSDSDGHPGAASSSSQAPGGPLTLRTRRARGPHPPNFPEPLSASIAAEAPSFGSLRASKTEDNITLAEQRGPHSKVYAPGMLKLSQSSASSPDIPKVASRAPDPPAYIRKKSGQLVKPSLKTSKSAGNVSFSSLAGSSKSEPTTPVCKAVHFDTQLEHVKLFLAEQKPRAVSRDGSPTDDTSGTDSDFPSFIFGGDSTARRRGKLLIDVVNMPPRVNTYADVILEKLWISPDNTSILGLTRVRNIAFAKLVAVRFTFDSWQTTSEVTARYQESISAEFDRFTFAIKLTDLLARIEEKTLILAVRYTVNGQELWDNNHTLNYVGKFTRSIRDRSLSDEEGDSKGNLESLQNKLEKVKEGSERTGPAFVAQAAVAVEADTDGPTFKSTSSFASRYDFSASLKNPWKYQESQPSHHRHNSFPQLGSSSSSPDIPVSPRATSPVKLVQAVGSGPVPTVAIDDASSVATSRPEAQSRNHRRGYFDMNSFNAVSVKMTAPTSPPSMRALDDDVPGLDAVILGERLEPIRTKPVPAISSSQHLGVDVNMASYGLFMGGEDFDSELSTPSLATPSSSRETTPSPTERFADLPLGSASHDYRDLINQ